MSRAYFTPNGYGAKTVGRTGRNYQAREYYHSADNGTTSYRTDKSIKKVLSPELDIFSSLPEKIFSNDHVKMFLGEMSLCISGLDKEELSGIVLPKLCLTEFTDVTIVIEWIFNYFRLYFSFDKTEGDYCGKVMNNSETMTFRNEYRKMETKDYRSVAEAEVAYALRMAEGGK